MIRKVLLGTAAAALLASLGMTEANAQTALPYTNVSSGGVWWGNTGATADLMLYYDDSAPGPLVLADYGVADVRRNPISETLKTCGSAVNGQRVLQPGGICWVAVTGRTAASIVGYFVVGNSGGTPVDAQAYVRASLEISDSSGHVISHIELH